MKNMQKLTRTVILVSIVSIFSGCASVSENLGNMYETAKNALPNNVYGQNGRQMTHVTGDQWRPAFLPVFDYKQIEQAKETGLYLTDGMSFSLHQPRNRNSRNQQRDQQRDDKSHQYGYPIKVYVNYYEAKICTPSFYTDIGLWVHFSRGAAQALGNSNYLQPQYCEFVGYCEVVDTQ